MTKTIDMLFTGLSLVSYLKDTFVSGKALLPSEVLSANDVVVAERYILAGDVEKTRNRIFSVDSTSSNLSYFIKQPRYFTIDRLSSITTEARVYLIMNEIDLLIQVMPKFICFDKINYLLITEFIQGIVPFISEDSRLKPDRNPDQAITIAQNFGLLLHLFGKILTRRLVDSDENYRRYFPHKLPFPLGLSRNELFRLRFSESKAQANFSKDLYTYYDHLEKVKEHWEASVLMHGDVKFDNFLINTQNQVFLIDWEMADIGDPHWDVAGVWASYISFNGSFVKCIDLLKAVLSAYTHYVSDIVLEKLILFTSVHLLQDAYYAMENEGQARSISQPGLNWAFSALQNPTPYVLQLLME